MRQLLHDQVDHLSQRGVLVLEQLRDAEEQLGGLVGGESFASEQQHGDLGEKSSAFPRRDRRNIEKACCVAGPFISKAGFLTISLCLDRNTVPRNWTYHLGRLRSGQA